MSTINLQAQIDCAWAAGLFEGEGSIHKKRNQISITSSDLDVITKFMDIFKVGRIMTKQPGKLGKKTLYVWEVYACEEVSWVLTGMIEHFGERRRALAEDALERCRATAARKRRVDL